MRRRLLLLISLCLLSTTVLWAQVNTAQINGTVSDTSGAVVPKVQITVSNPATGFSRSTTSSDTGTYTFALLPPGTYDIRVEIQGFQTVVQKGVPLAVGQALTLNFSLQPGAISQIVEVSGEAPLIELTRSEIGGSVSPLEVKELPVLNRDFAGLTYIVPGVRPAEGFDPTKSRVGNMSLNGGDGRQFDLNVDGGDNKDNVVGGMLQAFTFEGIQEFNVVTNHYTAESGRTSAGIVNVVTKSGTNDFHGSVFGLFQSSTFNRQDVFSKPSPKPVFHRYHYGFSVGGRVVRDKLFFFGAYENKREPGAIGVEPTAFTELSLFPLASPVRQLPFNYLDHLLTIKIDYHLSDKSNMFFRYGRQRWTQPNDQIGVPFTVDSTQTTNNLNQFHDFTIGHNYTLSPTKVNSFNVHFQDFVNAIVSDPARTFTLAVAGGGTTTNPDIVFPGGAEIGSNVNVPQQTLIRKYQFRDDFAWTHGRHNMKLGANWIYLAKFGGSFFFGANGYQVFFWDDPSTILNPANAAAYPTGFSTPGAVREIDFFGGDGTFKQRPHALAFYFQDDFKIRPRLTLNLGLRWEANIRFLPQQLGDTATTTNRTIDVLRQVVAANPATPAAQEGLLFMRELVGNTGNLRRTTASWKEFQPRFGFAWDPTGEGKHVIRGGYGLAYDQVFQNLTLFSLQQARPSLYQQLLAISDSTGPLDAGGATGPLAGFQFNVTPLPAAAFGIPDPNCPPGVTAIAPFDIACGAFGRINDPKMKDPYVQQWSLGWAWEFNPNWAFSIDYYHVLGIHESRVQNINPRIDQICRASFPGSNPADPRCVSGSSTRFFDAAFAAVPTVQAGRLGQINMIGTTNRSRFDSFNFVLNKRFANRYSLRASYVLSWAKSWGGRPTASYSGNGIAVTPDRQFLPGQFVSSIFDERHRFVLDAHVELPYGFEVTPLFQAASARPFSFRAGRDVDGDGRTTIDDVCVGSTLALAIATPGCQQVPINSLRGDSLWELDVRFGKVFRFHKERLALRLYWEFYNLFDTNNFGNNFGQTCNPVPSTGGPCSSSSFNVPLGYFGGQGFGPANSGPLRSQYGFRFEW